MSRIDDPFNLNQSPRFNFANVSRQQPINLLADSSPIESGLFSAIKSVGSAAWHTLDYTLGVLDDAIAHPFRALAAGNVEGLATLIPFHNTLFGMDVEKTTGIVTGKHSL